MSVWNGELDGRAHGRITGSKVTEACTLANID
jgi:hypothetical protein